jgi:hypothetical protein
MDNNLLSNHKAMYIDLLYIKAMLGTNLYIGGTPGENKETICNSFHNMISGICVLVSLHCRLISKKSLSQSQGNLITAH